MTKYVLVMSLLLGSGCEKESQPTADSTSTPRAAGSPKGTVAPTASTTASARVAAGVPVAPPARDILPGMPIADAKAKGAVGESANLVLKWKPNIDVVVDDDMDVVSSLRVEYAKSELDSLRAQWGEPNVPSSDDAWLGPEWIANLDGCSGDTCAVSFRRSPLLSVGQAPALPGALSQVKPGMTPAEVKSATHMAIPIGPGSDDGFGWEVVASYNGDDKLEEVTVHPRVGNNDFWTSHIIERWGAPTDVDGKKVWTNTKSGWHVEIGGVKLLAFRLPPTDDTP